MPVAFDNSRSVSILPGRGLHVKPIHLANTTLNARCMRTICLKAPGLLHLVTAHLGVEGVSHGAVATADSMEPSCTSK